MEENKSQIFDIDVSEDLKEEIIEMETVNRNDRVFNILMEMVPDIKEGDMIDIDGYRGQGIWYFDGKKFISSMGEYGYFLPPEAWKMAQKYGLEFFSDTHGVEFILLPRNAVVSSKGKDVNPEGLAINLRPDELSDEEFENITINGKTYFNSFLDYY